VAGNGPDQWAQVVLLPSEQRRATGMDDVATRANAANERNRGEAGPGVSGRGAGESGKKRSGGDGALTGGPG
jgi:hypothetical protein